MFARVKLRDLKEDQIFFSVLEYKDAVMRWDRDQQPINHPPTELTLIFFQDEQEQEKQSAELLIRGSLTRIFVIEFLDSQLIDIWTERQWMESVNWLGKFDRKISFGERMKIYDDYKVSLVKKTMHSWTQLKEIVRLSIRELRKEKEELKKIINVRNN